jgi:hypothetical protein
MVDHVGGEAEQESGHEVRAGGSRSGSRVLMSTGYCVYLRQYCVYFRQYCVYLRQYCVYLRQYCVYLRPGNIQLNSSQQPAPDTSPLYFPPPHPLATSEMSTRSGERTEGYGAAYSGRQPNLQSVNRFTPTPQHPGATASHPSSLGPTASRALALFCDCLENGMSARLVMRSARVGNNISFTCRELNSSAATAEQSRKKRPASSKKREKDKRRREIWLERRNCPSSAGPPLSSQQLQPQQQPQRTTAARADSAAAVSVGSLSDTFSTAEAGTSATSTPSILPYGKCSKTTARTAIRASERPSVVA